MAKKIIVEPEPNWWQRHGNSAQWAAVVIAIVLGAFNIGVTFHFRNTENQGKVSDEHLDNKIDAKLSPALTKIESEISQIRSDLALLTGRFNQLDEDQRRNSRLQLDKLSNQLTIARAKKQKSNPKMVARLGVDLLEIAGSNSDNSAVAWRVANETLSYYSSIIKIETKARYTFRPKDPSLECFISSPELGQRISVVGVGFEDCTQHLDPIARADRPHPIFRDILFKNVTIIYSGGPVTLENIYFENCTFQLESTKPGELLAKTFLAQNGVQNLTLP
jgi:hypothetical protein